MNKMKNFKRRFSLSVPRTETIEESLTEFTEQFNQLNNRRNEGKEPPGPLPRCWGWSGASRVSAASKHLHSSPPGLSLGVLECGKLLPLRQCCFPHLSSRINNTLSLNLT